MALCLKVAWLANGIARLVVAFAPWLRRRAEQPLADSLLGFLLPGLQDRTRLVAATLGPGLQHHERIACA